MIVQDLGTMPYRQAWQLQEQIHEEVCAGGEERIFFVEHPPVITLGRRPEVQRHITAAPPLLESLGVEVVQSDRGGDITFHGPGQLVAYPIIRLIDHRLSVGGYVRRLEEAVVLALRDFGIKAGKDACAIGVWTPAGRDLAKICAIGVRVRRGVTLHGLALNVTTDLNYFNLIVPCGLAGRPVTSMQKHLGDRTPGVQAVKEAMARRLQERFSIEAAALEDLPVFSGSCAM